MTSITVVDLKGKDGKVVGYATGTPEETANMVRSVWTASSETMSKEDVLRAAIVAKVQELRASCETNSVDIDGNVFSTDTGSQIKYVGALLHTTQNADFVASWKTLNNGYVQLDAEGISNTCSGVLAYIQSCYVWEQALMERLASAKTVKELQAIDILADKPHGKSQIRSTGPGRETTVSKGAAAGKGQSGCTLSPGSNDDVGEVCVDTDRTVSKVTGAAIFTVSFSKERSSTPFVVLQPSCASASALKFQPYVTATKSGFTLSIGAAAGALIPETEYKWTYHTR